MLAIEKFKEHFQLVSKYWKKNWTRINQELRSSKDARIILIIYC